MLPVRVGPPELTTSSIRLSRAGVIGSYVPITMAVRGRNDYRFPGVGGSGMLHPEGLTLITSDAFQNPSALYCFNAALTSSVMARPRSKR